jgi:hypothetical protein
VPLTLPTATVSHSLHCPLFSLLETSPHQPISLHEEHHWSHTLSPFTQSAGLTYCLKRAPKTIPKKVTIPKMSTNFSFNPITRQLVLVVRDYVTDLRKANEADTQHSWEEDEHIRAGLLASSRRIDRVDRWVETTTLEPEWHPVESDDEEVLNPVPEMSLIDAQDLDQEIEDAGDEFFDGQWFDEGPMEVGYEQEGIVEGEGELENEGADDAQEAYRADYHYWADDEQEEEEEAGFGDEDLDYPSESLLEYEDVWYRE